MKNCELFYFVHIWDLDPAFKSRESIIQLCHWVNQNKIPEIFWLPPKGADLNPLVKSKNTNKQKWLQCLHLFWNCFGTFVCQDFHYWNEFECGYEKALRRNQFRNQSWLILFSNFGSLQLKFCCLCCTIDRLSWSPGQRDERSSRRTWSHGRNQCWSTKIWSPDQEKTK